MQCFLYTAILPLSAFLIAQLPGTGPTVGHTHLTFVYAVQPLMTVASPNACNPEPDPCAWDSEALQCSGAVSGDQKL